MNSFFLTLLILLSISTHAQTPSQAEQDLNIIEGEYVLKSGPLSFCAPGQVGWLTIKNEDKPDLILMVSARFIFSNINGPEQKQTFPDCEYTKKTSTKRVSGVGHLTELETRICQSVTDTTRRTLKVEKDKIYLDASNKSSENGTTSKSCVYELKRPSREAQSVKK